LRFPPPLVVSFTSFKWLWNSLTPFLSRSETRTSGSSSYAPSSYQRKRAKLSTSTPITSPSTSRPGSSQGHEQPHASGSWPSRVHGRPLSRVTSGPPSNRSIDKHRLHPRRSMSQSSVPISALISPHPPSISPSAKFHMRDPRKPKKIQRTGWTLHFASKGEPGTGSPMHAWCFFVGFVIFPLWWVASFWRTPKTRRVGGTDVEKAVTLDDPQVEFGACSFSLPAHFPLLTRSLRQMRNRGDFGVALCLVSRSLLIFHSLSSSSSSNIDTVNFLRFFSVAWTRPFIA